MNDITQYYTYSDWLAATDKPTFIMSVINNYRSSKFYLDAVEAEEYFTGRNPGITTRPKWTMKKSGRQITFSKNIAISNFFFRCVVQLNQTLLANGIQLKDKAERDKLGFGFDESLEEAGELAITHGVCWGFFDLDHLNVFPATQFVALLDERTSNPMIGIRFWRISEDKPLYVELYEADGITEYATGDDGAKLAETKAKRPYKSTIRADAISSEIVDTEDYGEFPVVPLYANRYHTSEFTPPIKTKIDMFDKILSDFGDNLERTNDIYWVISNFGGTSDQVKELLAEIEELRVAALTDEGTKAEPHTIEVPYAARQTALDILRKSIYQDFMAMDMDEITGGSLTNVAIQTASYNLMTKVNRYERQVIKFCRKILKFAGLKEQSVNFLYNVVSNESETITSVLEIFHDGLLDKETALRKLPNVNDDEIDDILTRLALEDAETDNTRFPVGEEIAVTNAEVSQEAEQVAGKTLTGIQTTSLIGVIEKYAAGALTLQQAVNIVSVSIGVTPDEARRIIEGLE